MHFLHLVSYIVREFIAETLGKPVADVGPEHFYWYANYLHSVHRGGFANTVREIFAVLFREPPKSEQVKDFVSSWIRNTEPLVNALFNDIDMSKFKRNRFSSNDFHCYNLKRNNWYLTAEMRRFDPSQTTLDDIDFVFETYGNPVFPVTDNPEHNAPRPKRLCEDYRQLSPPRRVRRKCCPFVCETLPAEHDLGTNEVTCEREISSPEDDLVLNEVTDVEYEENARLPVEPIRQFVVGEAVNVIRGNEPYLAAYITRLDGDDVFVKFPFSQHKHYEYRYSIESTLPFKTQYPNGKYSPLPYKGTRSVTYRRNKIKVCEERLNRYFNELNNVK